MATCTLLRWEPRLQAPLATGRAGVSSAGTGRPHQIWSFSYGPGGWACCLGTRPMGGWASISLFCSGRAGGRRDFVVENRVGVGGRPGTPGPVGGPVRKAGFVSVASVGSALFRPFFPSRGRSQLRALVEINATESNSFSCAHVPNRPDVAHAHASVVCCLPPGRWSFDGPTCWA